MELSIIIKMTMFKTIEMKMGTNKFLEDNAKI